MCCLLLNNINGECFSHLNIMLVLAMLVFVACIAQPHSTPAPGGQSTDPGDCLHCSGLGSGHHIVATMMMRCSTL